MKCTWVYVLLNGNKITLVKTICGPTLRAVDTAGAARGLGAIYTAVPCPRPYRSSRLPAAHLTRIVGPLSSRKAVAEQSPAARHHRASSEQSGHIPGIFRAYSGHIPGISGHIRTYPDIIEQPDIWGQKNDHRVRYGLVPDRVPSGPSPDHVSSCPGPCRRFHVSAAFAVGRAARPSSAMSRPNMACSRRRHGGLRTCILFHGRSVQLWSRRRRG